MSNMEVKVKKFVKTSTNISGDVFVKWRVEPYGVSVPLAFPFLHSEMIVIVKVQCKLACC